VEQFGLPGVRAEADNNSREQKFLRSLESDSVVVEFPRNPLNSYHDPALNETRDYLKKFTADNPQHSFMLFETMSLDHGILFPHLVKAAIPEGFSVREATEVIQVYARALFANPPEGLVLFGARQYFTVIHDGKSHLAINNHPSSHYVEFDDPGFVEMR